MTSDNSRPPAPQGDSYPPSGERPYQPPSGQAYRPAPPAYNNYAPPGAPPAYNNYAPPGAPPPGYPTGPAPAGPPSGSPVPPPRRRRNPLLAWGGAAAGIAALAAITVLIIIPIFNRSTKTEADPFAAAATPAAATATGSATKPATSGAAQPPVTTAGAARPSATTTTTGAAPATQPARPGGPVVAGKGQFNRIDAIHYASGTATLGKTADGKNILRFDNFSSAQGPDLKVYLGLRPDGKQLKEGGINLGALPATDGSYNVPVPDNIDITKYKSVVIWCEAFSVTFSVATLG